MSYKPVKCLLVLLLIFMLFAENLTAIHSMEIPICAVDWNNEKQVIDGFGGSGAFHQAANLMTYPEKERDQILDLLFSQNKGIGLSIVRNIIGDGGDWGQLIDGPTPSIEPQEGTWNWIGDEDQIWLMNEAKKRGCDRFVSTAWSPPAWMKTNNNVVNGGELRLDKYQAFADYLVKYVQGYKKHHNIDIYAISPANEPDYTTAYSSCRWTGPQFKEFFKNYLIPTLKRDEVKVKVIMPEAMNFNEDYAIDTLNDPEASRGVDIVGAHAYDFKAKPFPVATSQKKAIWQTEVSNIGFNDSSIDDGLKYAKLLHDHMTITGTNAWLFWWLFAYKDGEALIHLDIALKTFKTSKRLYTIGNYSRFVRPGYVRINTDINPADDIWVTAYKDKNSGKFAIVAINTGKEERTINFKLNEFPKLGTLVPYRTSATESLAKLGKIAFFKGAFRASLKAKSVTTFIAANHELPGQLSIKEILSPIEAESYEAQSGVKLEPSNEGGSAVVYMEKGAFTSYRNFNFGNGTATCDLRIAIYGGGKLELFLDSPIGTLIGKYSVPEVEKKSTAWKETVWQTIMVPTEKAQGVHDLYLVFTPWDTGGLCKLDRLQFKGVVKAPAPKIKVQMENQSIGVSSDKIWSHFKVINTGTVPVKLEDVKIRYYYSLDSETSQQFEYSGGSIPSATVTGSVVKMSSVTPQANYYLEIGFNEASGSLEVGQEIELHATISSHGAPFRQDNDFSYNSKEEGLVDWENVTGYVKGELCWGNEPSLLINSGFEDGTANGWFSFGPNKATVSNETSHTGKYSVLLTDRNESWQGVSQDLLPVMKPGSAYEISAWIKLKDKAADAGRVSIKRTDDRGDNYSWVDSKTITNEGWALISGVYELNVEGSLKTLQLYTEGPGPGVEYYVDNVVVREVVDK